MLRSQTGVGGGLGGSTKVAPEDRPVWDHQEGRMIPSGVQLGSRENEAGREEAWKEEGEKVSTSVK